MLRKIGKMFMRNLVHVTNFFYLIVGIVIYLRYKHDVGKEFIRYFVIYYSVFLSLTLLFKVYYKITDKVKEKRKKKNENAEYIEREEECAKIFPEPAKYHEFLKQRLLAKGLDYTKYIKVTIWLVVFNSFFYRTKHMYDKDNFSDIHIAAAIMYSNTSKDNMYRMFNDIYSFGKIA